MKERVILHCDLNSFYASVECLYHPELHNRPVAVGGDVEKRHGIILTKNQIAKQYNIRVGEAIWLAKKKCPDLVVLPARFALYQRFSRLVRAILSEYTDRIEPFGIDEAWLDVTDCATLFGDGKTIADQLRRRIRDEVGITASVGVSFNKVFAKLGSDYRKPDATTVITMDNMAKIVWPLSAKDLLYVGEATYRKLVSLGIFTIGDLAACDEPFLKRQFGKGGTTLWKFANGLDDSPVRYYWEQEPVKSVGNSITTPKDITNMEELKVVAYVLAESVGARLREQSLCGSVVSVCARDVHLKTIVRQRKLSYDTASDKEIARIALSLFAENVKERFPLRSIGIAVSALAPIADTVQLSFFENPMEKEKERKLEESIDLIRQRFGNSKIQRTVMLTDPTLSGFSPKEEHTIHPESYY